VRAPAASGLIAAILASGQADDEERTIVRGSQAGGWKPDHPFMQGVIDAASAKCPAHP
jgi:hypothetical protein